MDRELGYELYLLDPARGVDLWNRVMEAGKRYNIAPTGPSDIRRIEAGILNYGIDMTLDNNPYEVGSSASSTWTRQRISSAGKR